MSSKIDPIPEPWERAIDSLVEASAHLCGCFRCARLFAAAYDALGTAQNRFEEFRPWGLVNLILPELRRCSGWPKEV